MSAVVNGMAVVEALLTAQGLKAADEVWVHGMWTWDKWRACLRALRMGRRLVRMPHGALSGVYLRRQHPLYKRLVAPWERWLYAHSSRIVVTGEWEERWCREWGLKGPFERLDLRQFFRLGADAPSRVDYLRGYVAAATDAERVAMLASALGRAAAAGARHFLYLGRRHPLKGLSLLKEAAARVDGVELQVAAAAFGEAKERLWEWCEVLVQPTFSENFSLVVAEALERGKRVVVTDGAPAWAPENWKE